MAEATDDSCAKTHTARIAQALGDHASDAPIGRLRPRSDHGSSRSSPPQRRQRQLQYERYYAGDAVRTGASIYTMSDQASLLAMIERALLMSPEQSN
jgi:hypothetical protein